MNDVEFHNSFRIRLFEFIHNDQHSYRDTPYHYLIYVYKGSARFVCSQSACSIGPGDFLYLPIGLDYRSSWSSRTQMRFLSLGFTHLPMTENVRYCMQRIEGTPEARALADRLSRNLHINCTTVGLVYQLMGHLQNRMTCTLESEKAALVNAAGRYWQKHPFATAAETAQHLGISESSLYAAFRKVQSCTPVQAKHRLLINNAAELLLNTDLSIEALSERLGFSSAAYFRKVFRAQTGMSPRDVRRCREKPGLRDRSITLPPIKE